MQPKKKALEIAGFAIGKHAKDVVILNVKKLSTVADYLVICSADSERQVAAIADAIEDGMRKKNARPMGVEGAKAGRWALMDFNDVVAHIFHEPVRRFYDLDGLWADAPRIEAEDRPKQGLPGSL
ncbi:MAG: ribosome silencing factor [Deltaproteobacteria bacterium]|nr:ribosome silencing factor [Deltaproteobacteria bacterium]